MKEIAHSFHGMFKHGLIAAALICSLSQAAPFRVGFVGGKHHSEEFSSVPRNLAGDGWEFENFIETDQESAEIIKGKLISSLDKLDMVA